MADSKENENVEDTTEATGFLEKTPLEQLTQGHKLQRDRIAVLNAELDELGDSDEDKAKKQMALAELDAYGIKSTADRKKALETA